MAEVGATWKRVVGWCHAKGWDDRTIFIVGTSLANLLTYWIFNAVLFVCYRFDLFPQYRINKGEMPPQSLINTCIKLLLVKHFLLYPIILFFAYPFFVQGGVAIGAPLPSWVRVGRDILVNIAINDTLFYWAHRLLHHPAIYQHIHKQHHQFNYTVGIAASYAHPIEDIFANVLPTILGPLLQQSHIVVFWFWIVLRLVETIDVHSGYSFPLSPFHLLPFQCGAEGHDFHHHINKGCYGSFTMFWDWICGTDKDLQEFKARKALESRSKRS
jgi:sterol desaturase/sphingolipid hydroxylase (fatty acid hydroxylase superfamily)